MRLKICMLFILTCIMIHTLSLKGNASELSKMGAWKGVITNREGKNFKANIGIQKIGNIYKIRGISEDKKVMWYGDGQLDKQIFTYTYKVRNKPLKGVAILKLSADGLRLEGEFEEGKKKVKGNEKWRKIIFSTNSKKQEKKVPDKKIDEKNIPQN